MRINEVDDQLSEGLGDWMRAGLYNTLGIGGEKGNAAANMYHFRDGFTQQYKQSVNAAKESGLPMDYGRFIDSYMGRYGWTANKKQKKYLMTLVNDPKKLSKAMYAVGMSQERDPQGNIIGKNQNAGAAKGAKAGRGAGQNSQQLAKELQKAIAQLNKVKSGPQLNSTSQTVINNINQLTGPQNLDDLAAITKVAMQALYAQSKEKYNELYKEITTGQKADMSPEEQIAAKRVEKLKAAAKAADAEAMPFSKLPGAPGTPDDFAARRKAKQQSAAKAADAEAMPFSKVPGAAQTPADQFAAKRLAKQQAAMAALNAPAGAKPKALPGTTVEPPAGKISKVPGTTVPKGQDGKELPTDPSKNPRQNPGAMFSKQATPAKKIARKPLSIAENSQSKPKFFSNRNK